MNFFWCQGIFFLLILIPKIDGKMNLRVITKNLGADLKIGCPLKIEFRADLTHESNPTTCELNSIHLNSYSKKVIFHV